MVGSFVAFTTDLACALLCGRNSKL